MVTKNDNTEAIRNPHAHPRVSKESKWNDLSNGTIIRDRNALEAVEKAKEERNSHETKRTHITKNDNTKPNHLFHANPRPSRRSKLNWMLHRFAPLKGKNKREMKSYWQKQKAAKTTKNSPRPLHATPTKQILLPNTLNTSNIQYIKAPINQNSQRPNIRSSNDSRRRKTVERAKIDGFFGFFRRSSKGTTENPLPPFPNSSHA